MVEWNLKTSCVIIMVSTGRASRWQVSVRLIMYMTGHGNTRGRRRDKKYNNAGPSSTTAVTTLIIHHTKQIGIDCTVMYCTVLCYIFHFYVMSCTYLYCTTAMDTFLYYNHCYISTVQSCSEMYGTVKLKTLAVSAR